MSIDLKETFEKYNDDFLRSQDIATPLSKRPDLHAFLLLDQICPGAQDIVSASAHDEFWLSIDCAQLAEVITEDQVRDLIRCGVRYHAEYGALCMFA